MIVGKVNFAGLDYIIIDRFTYNNTEYLYIFEDISKKLDGKKIGEVQLEAKADFIFKCPDGKYENVVDDDLYSKLMQIVNKRNLTGVNKTIREYFDSKK